MEYRFFGAEASGVYPIASEFQAVKDQRHLYDLLKSVWCEYSCAPRLREKWSAFNPSLGQCSITAFLAQDIFGGKVYGVPLPSGDVHCFNAVNGALFDLTSEQFEGETLTYTTKYEQSRTAHFSSPEKFARYKYLKAELLKKL